MKTPRPPQIVDSQVPVVTQEIAAEASVWIARLHGPSRTPAMERECLAWQSRSEAHRWAFERVTDMWVDVPGVSVADAYAGAASAAKAAQSGSDGGGSGSDGVDGRRKRPRWPMVSVAAAVVILAAVAVNQWWGIESYATKVGEQQMVLLDDGTRISLNTDTRVRVDMGTALRSVKVLEGEALFEVAKDPKRPFVVRVADSEVVALGTVFAVRVSNHGTADDAMAVTLIEGQVSVKAVGQGGGAGIAPSQPVLMKAGDRVRLLKSALTPGAPSVPQLDRPRIEQLLAWRRSEVVFDGVSLPEAVAEMNRYSRTPITLVADSALSKLRVSGLYQTGDSVGFASAVAALHGLRLSTRDGRMELAPPP